MVIYHSRDGTHRSRLKDSTGGTMILRQGGLRAAELHLTDTLAAALAAHLIVAIEPVTASPR